MRYLFLLLALLAPATSVRAQWSIVSVHAEPIAKQTSDTPSFSLQATIRNDSSRTLYVWGQGKWCCVETYMKERDSSVWIRHQVGVCGTMGPMGWVPVEAGATFTVHRTEAIADIGRSLMLTFTMSGSDQAPRGEEVLLGEFKIPALSPSK